MSEQNRMENHHELRRFLHIAFRWADGRAKTDELIPKFDLAANWIRYAPNCWIMYTSRDPDSWYSLLRSHITDRDWLFIVELNIHNRQGWLPRSVWDWLRDPTKKLAGIEDTSHKTLWQIDPAKVFIHTDLQKFVAVDGIHYFVQLKRGDDADILAEIKRKVIACLNNELSQNLVPAGSLRGGLHGNFPVLALSPDYIDKLYDSGINPIRQTHDQVLIWGDLFYFDGQIHKMIGPNNLRHPLLDNFVLLSEPMVEK